MTESKDNSILIEDVQVSVIKYPLQKTYHLSFVALEEFVSIQTLFLFSNGSRIRTEVVPLLGYNEESEEKVLANIQAWSAEIKNTSVNQARSYVKEKVKEFPFSTSPLLTAIDRLDFVVHEMDHDSLEYVVPTSTGKVEEFKELLETNNTIKVKLTGNVQKDIDGLESLKMELINYPSKLRFDANQAYNYDDCTRLFDFITTSGLSSKVLYIEQPLPVGKEQEVGRLRKAYPSVNIMLDESVVTIEDLALAEDNDVRYVKLKLFKQGGIKELVSIAELANEKGIGVILGNGVATAVSNYIENEIYAKHPQLFLAPLESNGFKKTKVERAL